MLKTTIYMDEETKLALKRLAQVEGRTQAEILREAVTTYAATAKASRPKGFGAYRSGRADVSERAEDLLRAGDIPRS